MSNALPAPAQQPASRVVGRRPGEAATSYESDEYFDHQPTGKAALPGPGPLLENLTRCVIEILAGANGADWSATTNDYTALWWLE